MSSEDKYEHYNYDENVLHSGRSSGKKRTKSETEQNKHHDVAGPGHTRKVVEHMRNQDSNKKEERKSANKE